MGVRDWLTDLGLSEHAESFAKNGVDEAMLPELTNEDLKDLGVARLADRKRLLNAAASLAAGGGAHEGEPSTEPPSAGERRQVNVLIADLTGFTQLSSELGAERTHLTMWVDDLKRWKCAMASSAIVVAIAAAPSPSFASS